MLQTLVTSKTSQSPSLLDLKTLPLCLLGYPVLFVAVSYTPYKILCHQISPTDVSIFFKALQRYIATTKIDLYVLIFMSLCRPLLPPRSTSKVRS